MFYFCRFAPESKSQTPSLSEITGKPRRIQIHQPILNLKALILKPQWHYQGRSLNNNQYHVLLVLHHPKVVSFQMLVSQDLGEPQCRPQNIIVLIIMTLKMVPLTSGSPPNRARQYSSDVSLQDVQWTSAQDQDEGEAD